MLKGIFFVLCSGFLMGSGLFADALPQEKKKPEVITGKSSSSLILMSYNIRNGRGMDEKTDYARTSEVIKKVSPDIVALQEVDRKTDRSQKKDVLHELEQLTKMTGSYAKAIDLGGGEYGVGLLSREKPQSVKSTPLPGREEKRVLLQAEFKKYVIFVTHLSLKTPDRLEALGIIAREASVYKKPVFLMGDMNFTPDAEERTVLEKSFTVLTDMTQATFPASEPKECIDYIAVYRGEKSPSFAKPASERSVVDEPMASDHRPVRVVVPLSK